MRILVAIVAACLVAGMIAACTSSDHPSSSFAPTASGSTPESSSTPEASDCSHGAPYGSLTVFAERDPNAALSSTACVKRCGDGSIGTWGAGYNPAPTVSALPTGACTNEASCSMSAVRVFCTVGDSFGSALGALHQFECDCTGGQWVCAGNYFGGGAGVYDCRGIPDGGGSDAF